MKRKCLSIMIAVSAVTILFLVPICADCFTASIQPIQVCDDSGPIYCSAIEFDSRTLQSIFQQADLTLNILPIKRFNSSVYQTIDSIEEGNHLLGYQPGLIGLSPDPEIDDEANPTVLNVWFADSSFSPPGEAALAYVDYNRAWVISGLGVEVQTLILAHALGHNFGLNHVEDWFNVMNEMFFFTMTSLYDWQVAIIQASRFVTPVESCKVERKLK
jgi:hypothetical protein